MKRPLTGLVVAYAAGIWIGSLAGWPAMILLAVAATLLAAFLFLQRTRWGLATLLAAVVVAGTGAYREAVTISSPYDITHLLEQRDQNVQMQGVIVSDTGYRAVPLNEDDAERQRFELELTGLEHFGQWQPAVGRILVFVSETRDAEPLRYGDRIAFSAILRVPSPMRNPGAFDWRTWLERKGIHFTATIRKTDLVHVEAHDQGNPMIALSLRLSEYLEHALRLGLESEPKLAGALAGMVLGKRSEIPTETYADFQRTGVFHVFAINGLHVGLVTAVVLIVLRLVRIPRRWCAVAAVPLLILYVFATGAHPGAVRALVMACVWLIGWMLVRPADSLNSLAAAALVILVCAPTQLLDGGFILSFTVVLAIVTLTPRIEALLLSRIAPDPFLPRQFVPDWRMKAAAGLHRIVQLLSCSIAAWLGLLPLMAIYFHLFTPISIVANILVIPLLGCILALGLLTALAHVASAWLTVTLNNATGFLLSIMVHGVEWLGHVPFGHRFVQAPPLWLVWAYYGLGILLLSKWISAPRRGLAAVLAVPSYGQSAAIDSLFPANPTGFVTDKAGIFSVQQQSELTTLATHLRQTTNVELAIVTLPTLNDRAPVDVATEIGRRWGVGMKAAVGSENRNNGLVLLIMPRHGDTKGKCFLTTGNGMEGRITDVLATSVCTETIVPVIRSHNLDYGAGVIAGVQRIQQLASATKTAPADPAVTAPAGSHTGLWIAGVIIGIIAIVVLFIKMFGSDGEVPETEEATSTAPPEESSVAEDALGLGVAAAAAAAASKFKRRVEPREEDTPSRSSYSSSDSDSSSSGGGSSSGFGGGSDFGGGGGFSGGGGGGDI